MSSDSDGRNDPESKFSFGVIEMREAYEAEVRRLASVPARSANESRGFDPYNSGGFDRKQSWMRIRKR